MAQLVIGQNGDRIEDRLYIGLVLFAPLHSKEEYFSFVRFDKMENLELLADLSWTGKFDPLNRIPNKTRIKTFWLKLPSSPDEEPVSVFARVNKGKSFETECC